MRHSGFSAIEEASSHVTLDKSLHSQPYDLIILQAEMDGNNLGPLVRDIRHGRAHAHPFPLVMMLSGLGELSYVRKLVDCGPDDILLVPVSPELMVNRAKGLISRRKPFVVTQDYIGPDRRKAFRRSGTETIPLVDVPNPADVAINSMDPKIFQSKVDQVVVRINNLKIERYGTQIRWLDRNLQMLMESAEPDLQLMHTCSHHMVEVAEDLIERTAGWRDDRMGRATQTLLEAAQAWNHLEKKVAGSVLENLSQAVAQTNQEILRGLMHAKLTAAEVA